MGRLRQFLWSVAIILITAYLQSIEESTDLHIIEEKAEIAPVKDPDSSLGQLQHGVLNILGTPISLNQPAIKGLLEKKRGQEGSYILSNNKTGHYTMIAPSTESGYFLVHQFFDDFQPFKVENPVLALYSIARQKRYQLDHITYPGRPEVWQSSRQAFYKDVGDCEDHAILLADWLAGLGYNARVAVGDYKGEGHAWVVLFADGKEFILEATQKRGLKRMKVFPLAKLQPNYHPVYMFNREFFWHNTGSKFTTDYASPAWVKKSQYLIN